MPGYQTPIIVLQLQGRKLDTSVTWCTRAETSDMVTGLLKSSFSFFFRGVGEEKKTKQKKQRCKGVTWLHGAHVVSQVKQAPVDARLLSDWPSGDTPSIHQATPLPRHLILAAAWRTPCDSDAVSDYGDTSLQQFITPRFETCFLQHRVYQCRQVKIWTRSWGWMGNDRLHFFSE